MGALGRSPLPNTARAGAAAIGAALLLAVAAGASAPAVPTARASLPAIERQVMCVTCKIALNVAESPQADRERAFIAGLIERGEGEAQIKRALVAQYGSAVLALPAAHGFSLLAYLVPLAALLLLLGVLALLLPRWRRRGHQHGPGEPPAPLTPADAARLDADLARFE